MLEGGGGGGCAAVEVAEKRFHLITHTSQHTVMDRVGELRSIKEKKEEDRTCVSNITLRFGCAFLHSKHLFSHL